ncbi:MAG: hypothetical protein MK102_03060 [Fuerstiella sp.]|nr:hypothetical protein [Fuerstiella sp.]
MIRRLRIPVRLILLTTFLPVATAQLPQIRLSSVFPQGGAAGSTVRVGITESTDNDELSALLFSDPGITAIPAKDDSGAEIANTFDVSVGDGVEPGYYEVRLQGLFGVSNPRTFRVDTLPEVNESEPNNTADTAQPASISQIINARADAAGDIDNFRIAVVAGQTITIRTEAARIDSLMQPVVQVRNEAGRRIGRSRRTLDQEATIVVTSDRDQTLTVKIHDIVYGGGHKYPYRLTVDTRPLVDFVWPPVVPSGAETAVMLYGRHLPGGELTNLKINGTLLSRKLHFIDAVSAAGPSTGSSPAASAVDTQWWNDIDGNILRLAVCRGGIPVYRESDPITASGTQLTGPFTVAGRFRSRGNESTFRFFARKGDVRDIEVVSQRLGVPANSVLYVEKITKSEDGTETVKLLATEMDGRQNPGGNQLPTFTNDAAYRLKVKEDGIYQLRVGDRFAGSNASPDRFFVVDVHSPQPDFELIAFESIASADGAAPATTGSVCIRRGGNYEIPVYVIREDGHNLAITVTAEDLPEGITCVPAAIAPGKPGTKLLLKAADDAPEATVQFRITGTSDDLKREAHVATLLYDGINGLPRTGRLTHALMLNVMRDYEPFTVQFGLAEAVVHQDQQLLIPVTLKRRDGFNGKVDVTFIGQPKNVDVPTVSFAPDVATATARLYFKENAKTGSTQLLAYGTGPVKYRRNPWMAERAHTLVAEIQKQVDQQQTILNDATAATTAIDEEVATVTKSISALKNQLETEQTEITQLKSKIAKATGEEGATLAAIRKIQQTQLTAAATVEAANTPLDALETASKALESAATELARVTTEIAGQTKHLKTSIREAMENRKQRDAAQAGLTALQEKLKLAKATAAAAQQKQDKLNAKKTKADEAAKAADAAAQPKDVTVRAVASAIDLNVYTTPGKITAAVPDGGAIKRGTSIEVPVTITRKNDFAGAATVTLILPEGTGLTAEDINIPEDQTEGKMTITAAADASVADIANAVFRATTPEFNGRPASFDVPIALKVTE